MTRARTAAGSIERIPSAPPVRPITAREALVVEAIADAARLLECMERVVPAMDESRTALKQAGLALDQRLEDMGKQLTELSQMTQRRAVEYIAQRTKALADTSIEHQTTAMTQAGHRIFHEEVGSTLKQLTASLTHVLAESKRPWRLWWSHATTALTSAVLTAGLTVHWLQS